MVDFKTAAQVVSVLLLDVCNSQQTIMVQETTNVAMTDRYAHDIPVSVEEEYFPDEISILDIVHSNVQSMVDYAMIRYE